MDHGEVHVGAITLHHGVIPRPDGLVTMVFGPNATFGEAASFTAPRADVILRPNDKVAKLSPEVAMYWGREVVIHDVPVEYPMSRTAMPAQSPASRPSR